MADWRHILETAASPIVLCSFGKDSLLLLDMCREIRQDVPVLHFGPLDLFAKNIIQQWNLVVYSYAPANRSILIDGGHTVLVDDYSFGGMMLPVIQDIEPGETCCGTLEHKPKLMSFDYDWSDTFCGWKARDSHEILTTQPKIIDGMPWGSTRLWAPLRDLTDTDVYHELERRGIPIPEPDSDTRKLCTRCLRGQPTFCPMVGHEVQPWTWNPKDSLAAFQARFQ